VIRRFHAKFIPRSGQMCVHYGQTYDKERWIAKGLRHGVPTKFGITAGELVNPPSITRFSRHLLDLQESVYNSSRNKALEKPPDPTGALPSGLDPNKFVFGVWNERGMDCAF